MSITVTQRGSRHQLRVKHKLLPKLFFFTFDTESEARSYGTQLEALLARGVVPGELLTGDPKAADPLLIEVIRAYMKGAPITDSDDALLGNMLAELVGLRVGGLTYQWVERYVHGLKIARTLAPGTIRKRVGVMARVLDWHFRRTTPHGEMPLANPFRLLPRGYSTYSRNDAAELALQDKLPKQDKAKDLRLEPEAEDRVMRALAGEKRPDRERALVVDPAFTMLVQLILDTGLRLREAYRLRADQIDLNKGIIKVEGSKGHRGIVKPRHVPIKPSLKPLLKAYCKGRIGLLFPFWNGDPSQLELRRATSRLSMRFRVVFDYAEVSGFTEHDLRHEATCRWVEFRNPRGHWAFSDVEICRIMGWQDTNMMLRYASLRGEDLAARMT